MKPICLIASAVLALFSGAVAAQTQTDVQGRTQPNERQPAAVVQEAAPVQPPSLQAPVPQPGLLTQTPAPAGASGTQDGAPAQAQGTSTTAGVQPPAPILIETNIDLTSDPSPPADATAAHEEAVNALHWAKTEGCRSDPSPRECVRQAQDDYRNAMARPGRQTRR